MKTFSILLVALSFLSACSVDDKKNETTDLQADREKSQAMVPDMPESAMVKPEPGKKKNTISDVTIGMRDEKVKTLLGKPSKVEVLNPELGGRIEDWWYGSNQMIRITGGQVTRIVPDVKEEQEMLLKIRDAKERGEEAEAQRLIDEMKAGN